MHEYPQSQQPRRSRKKMWIGSAVAVVLLAGAGAGAILWATDRFDGNGESVSYAKPSTGAGKDKETGAGKQAAAPTADPDVSLPAGPFTDFKQTVKLEDGTRISKARVKGAKSGFDGSVWVWTPKEYDRPEYAKSAFPVMIALPGGNGNADNYWATMPKLGLHKAIAEGAAAGKSLPFIVVMPILNPDAKYYYDGSDIPGQAKMGT
ncbi:hypothetical protein GT352_26035, partial [Streptomyces sp. SID1046]|nr:hypothetical protein [Streptomyces sp. SID1046]